MFGNSIGISSSNRWHGTEYCSNVIAAHWFPIKTQSGNATSTQEKYLRCTSIAVVVWKHMPKKIKWLYLIFWLIVSQFHFG